MKKIFALTPVALIFGLVGTIQAATQTDVTLQGAIVETTCEVTANDGNATLYLGSFPKTDFIDSRTADTQPLVITLKNCAEYETGVLQISGIDKAGLFVSDASQTAGFQVISPEGIWLMNGHSVDIYADADGSQVLNFEAGLSVVSTSNVQAGFYHAPIKFSFISN
ncbi:MULTISPECIES: fimbrial protein [unclassified Serratia (in: enterobacteria)]|uniref:fimbrial protein n=1 Tax=unclassified Serratia (in: enterobacteria) TaxID=2647522 RepID=UPI000468656D|nr:MULTISPECIES: hypothetical protein [unclassified Serratia (in: enterobacteria)]